MIAYAQYNFKKEMPQFRLTKEGIMSILRKRDIVMGLVIYVVSLGIYLVALSFGELSVVYPIFASVFVFVMLVSHQMLKERISRGRVLGVILIITGIVLTALTFGM
ncbi:MAG: EamA family transporter [Candidatus Micrarchaeales archaeon]